MKRRKVLTVWFVACFILASLSNSSVVHGDDPWGYSPLMQALLSEESPLVIRMILETGVDVNYSNEYGDTALLLACGTPRPNAEVVRLLLEAGADVNATNMYGETPMALVFLADVLDPQVVKLVIEG
mgnify:CR=1 FL=1